MAKSANDGAVCKRTQKEKRTVCRKRNGVFHERSKFCRRCASESECRDAFNPKFSASLLASSASG